MPKRPNILLVMTDEHAPNVAGFAGDEIVQTPNLDRLAARSVQFDAAICASPVCTPSRMCMLTARDVHRCGAWNNHWAIFPEHTTWPERFVQEGYRTCLVGKMHFGGRDQMQGFQHRPYGDLRHGLGHQPDPIELFPAYHGPLGAGVSEIPESLMQENVVTRETLAFLLEHADAQPETPWFCCASYCRPHSPYTAPGRYIRRYRDRLPTIGAPAEHEAQLDPFTRRLFRLYGMDRVDAEQNQRALEAYYACVDFVDDCIGELLDGLSRAGLLDNTVVIYTSDHGDMIGSHGMWCKAVPYDNSVRVPLLISGPGVAGGQQRVADPVSLMDLYPTTCRLAGIEPPDGLDGVDLSATLADPAGAPAARAFAPSSLFYYGVRVRGGTALPEDQPACAWRSVQSRQWKYVDIERAEPLLFDLENDPGEQDNLAGDPQHAVRRRTMQAAVENGFSWDAAHRQLAEDRQRIQAFRSGVKPTTPNQYMLPDGRIFDAERELYEARWQHVPTTFGGGIIPQQFG